jgi:hypothetical protein
MVRIDTHLWKKGDLPTQLYTIGGKNAAVFIHSMRGQ